MSGPPDAHAWRAAHASNEDPSPTIYLGSPIIDGPNPVWPESIVVTDEAQGREVVEQQRERGADFIKVYSTPTSRSPTRSTSVVFHSKGMFRNR
jgi:hypothetical protein